MRQQRFDKKGFTLVELLVVIAIIALLLSIMMPALNKVREQARQTVCSNSLKELGLATFTYATTTGCLPVWGDTISNNWADPPYQTKPKDWSKAFATPIACLIKNGDLKDDKLIRNACPTSKPKMEISYGYNYFYLGSKNTGGPVKITHVERPAETGMYADGHNFDWNSYPPPFGPKSSRGGRNSGSYGFNFWDYEGMLGAYKPIGHKGGLFIDASCVDGHVVSLPMDNKGQYGLYYPSFGKTRNSWLDIYTGAKVWFWQTRKNSELGYWW
jgi:prepilin-type N-terminal cleavage/methylation domain-containing protein